ncbi:MAG: Na+/H+ antiporter subunit D, partial [Anaerolineales bacterium]|nr:Na+/H+ antiporter subunit D [Anaerolineales bacterium]
MLIFLPVLVPFMTAILCILFWGRREIHRPLSLLGSAVALLVALALLRTVSVNGIQVLQMGNWPAPFGISFVADLLSAVMILVTAVMGLMVNIYALSEIDETQEQNGYHILYQLLLMGVSGSFLTGDLFNLFVWFEIMLISSFVLLALKGERAQLEGAVKYVT